jgi:WD40 repeat protein
VRVWDLSIDPDATDVNNPGPPPPSPTQPHLHPQTGRFALTGHCGRITGVAVVGGVIITASWDMSIAFWDAPSGLLLASVPNAHTAAINGLAASRDREEVATCNPPPPPRPI